MTTSAQIKLFIVHLLQKHDRSLNDLAKSIHMSQGHLSNLLRDPKKDMKSSTIEKFAVAFGFKTWEFLQEAEGFSKKKLLLST